MSKRGREGEENPADADEESASAVLKRQKQDVSGKVILAASLPQVTHWCAVWSTG